MTATRRSAGTEKQDNRVVRRCDVCGQMDDHPRHVVYDSVAHPRNPGEFIDIGYIRHMDCCEAAGCNHDGSCDVILAHVRSRNDGKTLRGADLRAHIEAHGDELRNLHEAAAYERHAAEHGAERIDRYMTGGPLYLEHEAEALRAAGVTSHRQLTEARR